MTRALTVPPKAHPLVRQVYALAIEHGMTMAPLLRRAGLHKSTLSDWRVDHYPRVDNLVALLNAMGYDLRIVPDERPKAPKQEAML